MPIDSCRLLIQAGAMLGIRWRWPFDSVSGNAIGQLLETTGREFFCIICADERPTRGSKRLGDLWSDELVTALGRSNLGSWKLNMAGISVRSPKTQTCSTWDAP